MCEDTSSRAWTEKEELSEIVFCRARIDLGTEKEGSSQSCDEGGMYHDDDDHVSKSRKLEKRRIHKQKQRANFSAKIESYDDLETRMNHMESLATGHFDEEPDRVLKRAEWEAIAEDSAKKASDARELLRLKKKEEDELKAKAITASPAPRMIMAAVAPESPIDDVFGALVTRGEDTEIPEIPVTANSHRRWIWVHVTYKLASRLK